MGAALKQWEQMPNMKVMEMDAAAGRKMMFDKSPHVQTLNGHDCTVTFQVGENQFIQMGVADPATWMKNQALMQSTYGELIGEWIGHLSKVESHVFGNTDYPGMKESWAGWNSMDWCN